MKIDIRSDKCLYIEIDDHIYYIDNSTDEQITDKWEKGKEDMVGFEGTWERLDKLLNIKHLPDKKEK